MRLSWCRPRSLPSGAVPGATSSPVGSRFKAGPVQEEAVLPEGKLPQPVRAWGGGQGPRVSECPLWARPQGQRGHRPSYIDELSEAFPAPPRGGVGRQTQRLNGGNRALSSQSGRAFWSWADRTGGEGAEPQLPGRLASCVLG